MLIPKIVTDFLVTADKQKIAYCHYNCGHDKAVIIAHGFYNSKDAVLLRNLAESLTDIYDVFMFDFRGHGKSSGLFTWLSREEKDLNAALDYLEGKYAKTGMIAFSLGASVAINTLSKDKRIDSLICVSAVSDFDKIDYQFWRLDWDGDLVYTLFTKEGKIGRGFRLGPFWLKKQKPIESVSKVQIPILYIHGDKDWVIKPQHSEALFSKTTSLKKIVIIKNGPHAEYLMKDCREEFIGELKKWFQATLCDRK